MSTAVVILAAGNSSRLGRSKQLLELWGTTLLRRTIDAVLNSKVDQMLVVLGSESERHLALVPSDNGIGVLIHSDWKNGMGSSIKAGLNQILLKDSSIESVIFSVCDQPFINSDCYDQLLEAAKDSSYDIVASLYESNNKGVPVLFKSTLFNDVLKINDMTGAKKLITNSLSNVGLVPFNQGDIDIDTEEQYLKVKNLKTN